MAATRSKSRRRISSPPSVKAHNSEDELWPVETTQERQMWENVPDSVLNQGVRDRSPPASSQEYWDAIDATEAVEVESLVETDTESSPSTSRNVSFAFSNIISTTGSMTSLETTSTSSSYRVGRKRTFDYTDSFARSPTPASPSPKFRKTSRRHDKSSQNPSVSVQTELTRQTLHVPPSPSTSDLSRPTRPQSSLRKSSSTAMNASDLARQSSPVASSSTSSAHILSKMQGLVTAAFNAVTHSSPSSPHSHHSTPLPVPASAAGYTVIAHSPAAQKVMDQLKLPWGVQYELARGVCHGRWTWQDVASAELDKLKESNRASAHRVVAVMQPGVTSRASPADLALWTELDREEAAIIENRGRGLGLQGEWREDATWYGGKIQQIARLVKVEDDHTVPFKLRLEKMEKRKSNRFARFLGSRRLLQISIPQKLAFEGPKVMQKLHEFLQQKFVLCGRVFVPFHAKDRKVYLMEVNQDYGRAADLVKDQHRISLHDFVEWHNSVSLNMNQPTNKWITRFDLGLSVTIPVLQFSQENIFNIPDKVARLPPGEKASAEFVFTDGSGFINGAALSLIARHLGFTGRPTALQGRVAGAKGLWILHPTDQEPFGTPKIWIRPSQRKIKYDGGLHPAHLIFDLVAPPRVSIPSRLSKYTIMNLSHNGVGDEVFITLMREGLQKEVEALTQWESPQDMLLLWHAINQAGHVSGAKLQRLASGSSRALGVSGREFDDDESEEDREEESTPESSARDEYSGEPVNMYELVLELLQSGFHPLGLSLLYEKLRYIIKKKIETYIQEYHIAVPRSAEAFIIPDPCDPPVLEEGQIHFKSSQNLKDPLEDISPNILTGDVLIYRNPARVPSDVQKVTAVSHPRLSEYVDVIVLPAKGSRSMASLLAGGDYDGDVCVCIYEAAIVDAFTNARLCLPEPADFDKVNFEGSVERVEELYTRMNSMSPAHAQSELQRTLVSGLSDAGVGLYSKFHENTAYAFGYDDPRTLRHAFMFAKVLDARKTGLKVKKEVFAKDKRQYDRAQPKCMQSKKAAESESSSTSMHLRRPSSMPPFVLDKLLEAGAKIEAELINRFDSLKPRNLETLLDPNLLQPYKQAKELADHFKLAGVGMYAAELKAIEKHVADHIERYRAIGAQSHAPARSRGRAGAKPSSSREWRALSRSFDEGPPDLTLLPKTMCLAEVKASCAYGQHAKMAWAVAFRSLCALRAAASHGGAVVFAGAFADAMTMSSAAARVLSQNRAG
ncbi:RNA dependent RNA polymerase-domain-containing protein [Amylocystis lapponica]|nr:RNA dependent RNA polymerase-domain-containing protein [Amylocystis lapponica]